MLTLLCPYFTPDPSTSLTDASLTPPTRHCNAGLLVSLLDIYPSAPLFPQPGRRKPGLFSGALPNKEQSTGTHFTQKDVGLETETQGPVL